MYVNIRLTLGQINHAWLIPQVAVQRDAVGVYVFAVGADGKVAQKRITADSQQGADWIVTGGLADGDKIVVSGVQKVQPGAPAKALPWQPDGAAPPAAAAAAKH
jgi:membrane fusion protein (multidrug efflux system)